jgi:hypothetical protein
MPWILTVHSHADALLQTQYLNAIGWGQEEHTRQFKTHLGRCGKWCTVHLPTVALFLPRTLHLPFHLHSAITLMTNASGWASTRCIFWCAHLPWPQSETWGCCKTFAATPCHVQLPRPSTPSALLILNSEFHTHKCPLKSLIVKTIVLESEHSNRYYLNLVL